MGALLAVPIGFFISLLTTESSDIFYWWRKFISYIYLNIYHRKNDRRFDLYDNATMNDPYKTGFLAPPLEIELESPQPEAHLQNAADEAFFYGVNSKSECLVARVARSSNDEAEAWIYLKLANGKTYHLPPEVVHQQSGDKSVFSSDGLKMHYLSPMRRWRITYNGLLRETSKNDPEGRIVHGKFALIWVTSSSVFDTTCDLNISELTKALAREKWKSPFPPVKRLYEMLDFYAQSGMFMGTATIEGEDEREIYLWGGRSRFLGQTIHTEGMQFLQILGNTKNGSVFQIGMVSIPNIVKDFPVGYVVQSNGHIQALEKADFNFKGEQPFEREYKDFKVHFTAGFPYEMEVKFTGYAASFQSGQGWSGVAAFNHVDLTMNVHLGSGFVITGRATKVPPRKRTLLVAPQMPRVAPFVVPFTDDICQLSELTGGKGSSLGKLTQMSQEDRRFVVPKGIAVTTAAYKEFMQGDILEGIRALESIAYGKSAGNLKAICERISEDLAGMQIPEKICYTIETSLHQIFGESLNTLRFAVRSSATGEDTEQMSAAGQMETFLGVRGLKEIFSAVKKSWASQFGFVAIQYKRRYGQVLNSPMAVVIQEMVPCEIAGVMFTCDPVTSNPTFISISANYGLGESVVSATSEPDTVTLRRDINNKLSLDSVTVGSKALKIVMDDSGGTKEETISEESREKCCLSEEWALLLGNIGINVEKSYGSLRDIEWGILGNEVYMLQSRPVTSGDAETEFEIKHEFDAALRCENEYLSVCNVGEVLPGALSPLGLDILNKYFSIGFQDHRKLPTKVNLNHYFPFALYPFYNHMVISVVNSVFGLQGKPNNRVKANMISLFGRILDDEELFAIVAERHRGFKGIKTWQAMIAMARDLFFAGRTLRRSLKNYENYRIPVENYSSSTDLYNCLAHRCTDLTESLHRLMECFISSSMWNMSLLVTLASARGERLWLLYEEVQCISSSGFNFLLFIALFTGPEMRKSNARNAKDCKMFQAFPAIPVQRYYYCHKTEHFDTVVYSDFADLLSTCTNVESADVPAAIQSLAYTIAQNIKPEKFKSMKPEEALEWLQTSSNLAATKFKEFLTKHGHRCLKEFDLYSVPWGTNPLPLAKMLQGFAGNISKDSEAKVSIDSKEVISKLQVPLTFKSRLILRFLLPQARRGVRDRETSKSLAIKGMDAWRQAYFHLAKLMVLEGRIPDTDIFFFFTFNELGELLKTRSPKLLAKANHRRRVFPELNSYIFPEIMKGVPRPVNVTTSIDTGTDDMTLMKGIPVSQGVAKGYARVAMNLDEAASLKPGEILIAYSTDIGWSPYFPVLAGVVTELGGLVSHGAVVAREYGLPCVVGLRGATQAFRTGDFVLLDGTKGILQKILPPSEEDQ